MITLAQEIRTFFQTSSFQAGELALLEPILSDQNLVGCLTNRVIALAKKITVLQQAHVAAPIIDDLFFFAQLQHHHQLDFQAIKPYIEGIVAEQAGIPFVEIYTRESVDTATARNMQIAIKNQLFSQHDHCNFHFITDPDIIGGFRVCAQDTVWDYTLDAQLTAFHQQFISL